MGKSNVSFSLSYLITIDGFILTDGTQILRKYDELDEEAKELPTQIDSLKEFLECCDEEGIHQDSGLQILIVGYRRDLKLSGNKKLCWDNEVDYLAEPNIPSITNIKMPWKKYYELNKLTKFDATVKINYILKEEQ